MKKIIFPFTLAVVLAGWFGIALYEAIPEAQAQNVQCSDRPASSNDNSCANTRWVKANAGGGGGTPGGISGQIQYNNAGSFGGFTMSGDCTIVTSTGVITCTSSSGGGFAPVGTVIPWAGATVPTGYLLAYGQAVSRATYPALLTAITLASSMTCTSGSPTVPVTADISDRAPIGAPLEAAGCFNAGATVISKSAGFLTFSSNAIASTTVTFKVFPYGNGDASTTFNVPNMTGRAAFGRDNMSGTAAGTLTSTFFGANPDALGATGGSQSRTLLTSHLPPYTPTGTISTTTNLTNGTTIQQNTAGGMAPGVAGGIFSVPFINSVNITAASTSTFTGAAQGGSSSAFSLLNPAITLDWIIKALPDASLNGNIVVGTTVVDNGANTNILYNNNGIVGEYAVATNNDLNCATASKIVPANAVYQSETVTTYGTTTTFDFCTFKNTSVTLTGNITTMTFSNVVAGKAGMISFIQDGSGNHTTVWNPILKFSGGTTPTLSTAAGAVDILTYACRSPTFCGASLLLDVK